MKKNKGDKCMPRPQTKNDLIEAADLNFDKLLQLIDSMTEIEINTEFDFSSDANLNDKERLI